MNMFKKQLKRKDLENKYYGYHIKKNINTKDEAIKYLEEITNYLNKYTYKSNNDFIVDLHKNFDIGSRKKFIYDEIIDILDGKQKVEEPIYFILGSLEEFMCQNFIYPRMGGKEFADCRTKNDNYLMNGYICLEEKNCIMEMIKVIKERID